MGKPQNQLFPIFTKAEQLRILIVGGGNVAEEKLFFLLKNSPNANVTVIGKKVKSEIFNFEQKHQHIKIEERPIVNTDLKDRDLILIATDDSKLNKSLWEVAKREQTLVNVADTPHLCDFYLGSIVTKGDLKVAISTNGKSPTFAKRFRMVLEDTLPDEMPELLAQLNTIREKLTGDFKQKIKQLNEITAGLVDRN